MTTLLATEVSYSSPVTILTTALTVLLYALYRLKQTGSKVKPIRPPGPKGLPLFGNLFTVALSKMPQHMLVDKWSKQYGPVFWFKIFNTGVVIINDMDVVHETFQSPDVSDRMPFATCDRVLGRQQNGIAFSNGTRWKEQRKFFVSVFRKVDIGVTKLEEIVGSQVEIMVSKIRGFKGGRFDPSILINISIANIITRIITGVTYDHNNKDFQQIVACSGKLFDISGPAGLFALNPVFSQLPLPVNYEIQRLVEEILHFIHKSIDEHKRNFDPSKPAKDFIGSYLHEISNSNGNLKSFDDDNLVVSCFDALLAGWETVASTLRWTFFILTTHPEAMDRVREEIYDVVGSDRLPAISDRPHLPLTEATIAECMRFVPAVPIHLPHVVARDCKIGGYDVPKGSAVAANLLHFAKSPSLWEDPEEFRPERFLDESGTFMRGLEPIPFGYGKRQCPGEQLARMEMFLFVTYLLQNFHLKLPSEATGKLDGVLGLTWRPNVYELQASDVSFNKA
ncbi:cytochrome P450 2J4-like [Diadema setosum]|uniref:cytochrome P450 2J4-like n=1 Tax=Diadema setosum TaxID=31175 RepID=UPI003B3ACF82